MTMQRSPHSTTRRSLAAALLALTCSVGALTACGDDDDKGASTTVGNVLPPITADLTTIDGTTVSVPLGGNIDLTGDTKTFTDWKAEIADAKIVEFSPGRNEGGASFNPGLKALAVGTTTVKMTNSTSATTVSFTVDVKAA